MSFIKSKSAQPAYPLCKTVKCDEMLKKRSGLVKKGILAD
ncbi:hypothetical protein AO385_1396 [Moraxella catarrhalis]|uniref:Uncharacterized protein n=1 Tax=Moraxella catarrhalis TaxID=480 RepID=A0A198UEH2_MORCA|nr:hypothetical protein AO383_2153 [Moraxella catarrhalis]OAU94785.1 hypothetical protein AO384_2142 [Moraxella catarrhalis]OAU99613.1 hypothetical protein AO385_1396 [Moraxella catarrhalis]